MNYLKALIRPLVPKKYRPVIKQTWFTLRSLLYFGNQFICPCCSGHFRKFLPYRGRPNAICPRCGSAERHRLLWLYLKNKTNFFKDNLKVLHFAPQYILQKKIKSMPNIDYLSADLYSPLAMVKMDITNIQYKDGSFDVILCCHVLEHIMNDRKAMRELFRVLKPGGWAIIQSPVDLKLDETFEDPNVVLPEDREHIFGNKGHVRIYGRDYKDRLSQVGFNVKVDGYVKKLTDYKKYSLIKEEDIYLCERELLFDIEPKEVFQEELPEDKIK